MKFLCVCNHGNVRSHCMTRELKDLGHEAIAIGVCPNLGSNNGWNGFSDETIKVFCDWADLILDFSDMGTERLKVYGNKVKRYNIGLDRWYNPFHPELRGIMQKIIEEMKDGN